MLKDDAIRCGLIKPSKNDIDRMKLSDREMKAIAELTKTVEKEKKEGSFNPNTAAKRKVTAANLPPDKPKQEPAAQ